ncbi:MAG TPA: TldD/PmbA family protein, partial [Candidatus Aerophobetes bacterium]|nr:TldD/PmbA family protein [Candidatus Aerophobetes bacterium]
MMKEILEMAASSAEEAELYRVRSKSSEVIFEANRLKSIDSSFEEGLGLRIIKQGKIGFSSFTDLSQPGPLVKAASDSAQFGQKAHFHLPSADNT